MFLPLPATPGVSNCWPTTVLEGISAEEDTGTVGIGPNEPPDALAPLIKSF